MVLSIFEKVGKNVINNLKFLRKPKISLKFPKIYVGYPSKFKRLNAITANKIR